MHIQLKQITMTIEIKDLKKGQKFIFNYKEYTVKQSYKKWTSLDDLYLKTTCGEKFYTSILLVQLIQTN